VQLCPQKQHKKVYANYNKKQLGFIPLANNSLSGHSREEKCFEMIEIVSACPSAQDIALCDSTGNLIILKQRKHNVNNQYLNK
jgi:hypothetical protein